MPQGNTQNSYNYWNRTADLHFTRSHTNIPLTFTRHTLHPIIIGLDLAAIHDRLMTEGVPIISIDTKKKDLIGNFNNKGSTWEQSPAEVNDHDFRSSADGLAAPYGIYYIKNNLGFACIGTSYDTPEFVVSSIEK